jgi:hypothetical protein
MKMLQSIVEFLYAIRKPFPVLEQLLDVANIRQFIKTYAAGRMYPFG